jgi:hypothetical protein
MANTCAGFTAAVPVTVQPRIVCSSDGGVNWGTSAVVGTGDFPRITVGQDGFVYVVFVSGSSILINKYSSCANGLVQQTGFPRTVTSAFTGVNCATRTAPAGLDRCNGNNVLGGPTVAVDDTNANHIYVAYANTTATGNEDVILQDSTDGGVTWTRPAVTINTTATAHRFMPWVCSAGGAAFVSWYDTRFAVTGNSDDLTDFFGGSAVLDGAGNLTASSELRLSQVSDPTCATGWPAPANTRTSPEACPTQPQLAGTCSITTGTFCDFSDCTAGGGPPCQCPVGETCNTGRGFPKYGDYNGSACAINRFYASWASATSPPGVVPPSTNIDVFFACPPSPGLGTLTFTDTTAPIFATPPLPVTAMSCVGVALGNVVARDVCGTAPPTVSNNAPAIFPAGMSTVTWTATDAAGNWPTATQDVTDAVT